MPDERTEGATPERRRVVHVVQGINVAFLAVDVALYHARLPVVAGRLLVSAALLATSWSLAHIESARRLRRALVASVLAVVAGFALVAWGSGGADSPYLTFLAFVPIVLTIAVPDVPALPLAAGLAGTLVGVGFELAAGDRGARLGFVLVASGSCTFYGTASAALFRRMRRRERETAAALARSEQQRREAERLAAVGRLAAGMAHDINNPLACATASVRFVREEVGGVAADPELTAALDDANEALERIRALVADLRAFAGGDAAPVAEVDLAGTLDEAIRLAAQASGSIPVQRRVPDALPRVHASAPHLMQVLRTLLTLLAREAAAREGRGITVEAVHVGETVRVALTTRGGATDRAAHPAVPALGGVTVALCRELVERWGGGLESSESGWGDYVVTLRAAEAAPEGVGRAESSASS